MRLAGRVGPEAILRECLCLSSSGPEAASELRGVGVGFDPEIVHGHWHGKGPWDGFGGLLKRVMRRDTINNNVVITDYVIPADHLRKRFCTGDCQQKHVFDSRYVINKVTVMDSHSNDIDRRADEVYEPVIGIRKRFGYMALGKERVL